MKFLEKLKNLKWGYFFIFLITAIISVCFFVFGNDSLKALAISIGIIVILGAALLALLTLSSKVRGISFGIKMTFSVAMLITGIVTLISNESVINEIVGIFGLIMIVDGSFKFNTAASIKRIQVQSWVVMVAISIILITGGYITVRYLSVEDAMTIYILGTIFAIDSVSNLFMIFYTNAYENYNEKQVREKIRKEIEDEQENEQRQKDDSL